MKLYGLNDEQRAKIADYLYENDNYVDAFGLTFQITGLTSSYNSWGYGYKGAVELEMEMVACERPLPLTEEEKQLKHVNKLHEQDIEHKKRLIANNEAKLKRLQKMRGVYEQLSKQ